MPYIIAEESGFSHHTHPPAGMTRLSNSSKILSPPLTGALHTSFRTWSQLERSPGVLNPDRVWIDDQGRIAFQFVRGAEPQPLNHVAAAPDLAAWLVLLDKWMETYVVVARARTIWNISELGAALPFVAPAYLPPSLIAFPPDNWQRVAYALATALADGPLAGTPHDRHWKQD